MDRDTMVGVPLLLLLLSLSPKRLRHMVDREALDAVFVDCFPHDRAPQPLRQRDTVVPQRGINMAVLGHTLSSRGLPCGGHVGAEAKFEKAW